MAKIYGIDVSHHQGVIDWDKVSNWLKNKNNGGNGFAIIRVGYSSRSGNGGLILDTQAKRNLAECNRLNIPCGVYVYCYDTSATAAATTMKQALQLVKDYKLQYPVIYDVEYEPFNKTCGKATNTAMIKAAMTEIEKAGYYGMVYCSRDFFLNYTNLSGLDRYDKWEAAYTLTDNASVSNGIWQYSSKGKVDGISGNVDLDMAYKDYPALIGSLKQTISDGNSGNTLMLGPVSIGDKKKIIECIQPLVSQLQLESLYKWQ